MKIYQPTPQLESKVKMLENPQLSPGTSSHASPSSPVPNPGCAQHPPCLPPVSLPPPPQGLCVVMDEALLSLATPGTAQSWPCYMSKCSVPGDPGSKGGSPQKCGTGGSLPGSGPQSGKPDGEAASQAPGPALLTFSRPTPPRSCLHFRPHAAGSAKKLGLALLAWGRTPETHSASPPPQKSPGMGWQQGALSLHFSKTSIRCITPVSSIPLQQILPSPSVPQFLWQPSTERHRQILPAAEDKGLEPRHLQEAPPHPAS